MVGGPDSWFARAWHDPLSSDDVRLYNKKVQNLAQLKVGLEDGLRSENV